MAQAESNESEMQNVLHQAQTFMFALAGAGASPTFVVEEGYRYILAYLEPETFMKSQDMITAAQFVELCANKVGVHPEQLRRAARLSSRE